MIDISRLFSKYCRYMHGNIAVISSISIRKMRDEAVRRGCRARLLRIKKSRLGRKVFEDICRTYGYRYVTLVVTYRDYRSKGNKTRYVVFSRDDDGITYAYRYIAKSGNILITYVLHGEHLKPIIVLPIGTSLNSIKLPEVE